MSIHTLLHVESPAADVFTLTPEETSRWAQLKEGHRELADETVQTGLVLGRYAVDYLSGKSGRFETTFGERVANHGDVNTDVEDPFSEIVELIHGDTVRESGLRPGDAWLISKSSHIMFAGVLRSSGMRFDTQHGLFAPDGDLSSGTLVIAQTIDLTDETPNHIAYQGRQFHED